MPSRNWLVFGCDNEPEPLLPLRAGPLRLLYDSSNGFVRRIRAGDREVLRGIYVAVRDPNWGTVPPQMASFQSQVHADSFSLAFEAVCREGKTHFVWHGRIQGSSAGVIRYDFAGEAKSTFLRNRIGFCVLHPIRECADALARQTRTDGSVIKRCFPKHIEPQVFGQSSFRDLRAVAHEVVPGLWAEVEFEGDVFEMEDQRNWTDASFKTYCTPLALPFPVEIQAGTRIRQSVTLRLRSDVDGATRCQAEASTTESEAGAILLPDVPSTTLPRIGLSMASHGEPLSETAIARLRSLRLAHLRVDLRLSATDWPTVWGRALREAEQLGLGLELALHLPCQAQDSPQQWGRQLQKCSVPLVRVLALREGEAATAPATLLEVRRLLAEVDVPVGAGSDANFCELNRERALDRLARTGADFFFWSVNPQVHAVDHLSVIETLAAQPETVATARSFAGGKSLVVSPITLKPRFNAVATSTPAAVAPDELPATADARQASLFAAAWTLGSITALAQAGAASVTFYETTGWRGVLERSSGSPSNKFPSLPGGVFPVFHLFAELAGGGQMTSPLASPPMEVAALMIHDTAVRRRVLLGNLTRHDQRIRIQLPGSSLAARMRMLDAGNLALALCEPESFRAQAGESLMTRAGIVELSLPPHALTTFEVAASPRQ